MTNEGRAGIPESPSVVDIPTVVLALECIYGEVSSHPLYMGDDVTDEELVAIGGDAATISSVGAGLRLIIDRLRTPTIDA